MADKNETTADLEEFKSAIQSDSYTMEDDDFEGDKKIINPNAFFAGKVDPIKQLPQSEAKFLSVIGDKFTTDLVEDPTFGGFLPHWDQTYFKQNYWIGRCLIQMPPLLQPPRKFHLKANGHIQVGLVIYTYPKDKMKMHSMLTISILAGYT